ncbi:MAG: GNAT family N-acetyltransferase [Oscillospiraceae bacterium]|nr:GNAT family N-acetyltransferase [Oscillospiraceae bacterium]
MYYIAPMNLENAMEISKWTYDEPYVLYSFKECEETIHELLENDYYACRDLSNRLFGYFCFGDAATIPTYEEGYDEDALDMGLGMNPEFCGIGQGLDFLNFGLEFAKKYKMNEKNKIRFTVADFNKRAIHLYEKAGFKILRSVKHVKFEEKFNIMILNL